MNGVQYELLRPLGIGYMGILYFIVGGTLSYLSNLLSSRLSSHIDAKSSDLVIVGFIVIEMILITWIALYTRLLVRGIPFPFENKFGYKHKDQTEINGGVIIAFTIFYFQSELRRLLDLLFRQKKRFL
jgi:hypothetical protein